MDEELKKALETLNKDSVAFQSAVKQELAEIKTKGAPDPLTTEKINKINDALTKSEETISSMKRKLEVVETLQNKAGAHNGAENKSEDVIAHEKAFHGYLRKGIDTDLTGLQRKAMSVISDADGGYLVTPEMNSKIIKKVFETSPLRSVASIMSISSDSVEFMNDLDEVSAEWVAEAGTRNETDTPEIGKVTIYANELSAMPKITQKLLDDAAVNVESWLADKVADYFTRTENTAFINGNGVGKPRGILTYSAGTSWGTIEQISSESGSAGVISAEDIYNLIYGIKSAYLQGATFLMNRVTLGKVRKLRAAGGTGEFFWQPGLQAGQPPVLAGYPYLLCDDIPVPASNSLSIVFGNMQLAYQIVDRAGIRVLRDPFTSKPYVKFYTTKRVGGDVVNFEALKILKLDA